ncbi:MAG TPA: YdbL family protein [Xanthomonadaceae bacterium]|nr:YdbL family protein [Xanthomonadaceae bacterium]
MQTLRLSFLSLAVLVLSACVTINVYFPAAAAEQAAQEFIGKVIGETPKSEPEPEANNAAPARRGMLIAVLDFLIPPAHAQADINIRTPQIQAIQARMAERFQGQLQAHFDSGALGFTRNGLIEVRDPAQVGLRDRAALNQAVADDNRDRNAVYREIAQANGHPEWEDQIRQTFARQWIEQARSGWYYQDATGAWVQK